MARAARFRSAQSRAQEASLYAEAITELERGERDLGLWAKALAQSDGHESIAQARYLKLRASALKDEHQIRADIRASLAEEMERRARERVKSRGESADRDKDQEWPTDMEPDNSNDNPFSDKDDSESWTGVAIVLTILTIVVMLLVVRSY